VSAKWAFQGLTPLVVLTVRIVVTALAMQLMTRKGTD